ncbi:hypothetical protein G6F37_005984 [Rhizopus arrhizus]|nr:hypothetical protein G6F38_001710 [Rhizopus arrhizus]KAG1158234.1 hypothetical protein G6F37_005984 [Rhizopus arrhizus]
MTTPDSVSFGLWKHCYIYALNCSCSPANLRYQPDVSTVLQVATEHNATAPITTTTSLSRILPLTLATVFGATGFLLGLYTNKRGKYLYRRIIVGLILATAILVAYSFGYSYQRYFQMIKETCENTENHVHCAAHTVQTEVVLFAIALSFLFLSLIFWTLASSFFSKKANDAIQRDDMLDLAETKGSPATAQTKRKVLPQDEWATWGDGAMFDPDRIIWEEEKRGYDQDGSRGSPAEEYPKRSRPKHPELYEKPSLSPPPPPAAISKPYGRRQKRVSPPRSKQSEPRRHPQVRKESDDSAMTFGHRTRRKSSLGYSDWEQRYQTSRLNLGGGGARKTPTTISPHPSQHESRGSYCMTPHFNDSTESGYFPAQPDDRRKSSTSSLNLVLNTSSKVGIEHPLNKKVIVDKRIQDYFQNTSTHDL